ncbi:MAG: hypothetical protein R3212_09095 [Xanthomonadales bacterium]|nr:hypothetical protein [Xanthomonadales bacterium]
MVKRRILVLIAVSSTATPAWAYLDPGTGSMLLQVILGGVAAIGVGLKLYWHKLQAIFGFGPKSRDEDETAQSES